MVAKVLPGIICSVLLHMSPSLGEKGTTFMNLYHQQFLDGSMTSALSQLF